MYNEIIRQLKKSYDEKAGERDKKAISRWKIDERAKFLSFIQREQKETLLEIGAGTGKHGAFFSNCGLNVTCIDLSLENLRFCQQKNLTGAEMDFRYLGFPVNSFDALFAMNCLLHVPKEILSEILVEIKRTLVEDGLFYLGQYGGVDQQGVVSDDNYEPKRFYALLTDQDLLQMIEKFFEIIYVKFIPLDGENVFHFQSLVLRKKVVGN